MSTKQKHLDPGVLPLTRRTFLSSRYAKGSRAFRMDSMVVVGFTFLMIIAEQKQTDLMWILTISGHLTYTGCRSSYFCCLWRPRWTSLNSAEDGRGSPELLPAAHFLPVEAVGPSAAATPPASGRSSAATGWFSDQSRSVQSSAPLKNHLAWVWGALGAGACCDRVPKGRRKLNGF